MYEQQQDFKLELLGIGSVKDRKMKSVLEEALRRIDRNIPIREVKAVKDLMRYEISGIPALVINNQVVFQKEVPTPEELALVLQLAVTKVNYELPLSNILVPTDFSETAGNAYAFALQLAQKQEADIRLLHVHQPSLEVSNAYQLDQASRDFSKIEENLHQFSQNVLKTRLPRKGRNISIDVKQEVRVGPVLEEIKALSKSQDPDLIVMGTTGQGGFLNKLFGSISSEIARKAERPVLLIPQQARYAPFKRIVFASAQQPGEEKVWAPVLRLAAASEAELHFAHITPNILDGFEVRECAIQVPNGRKTVTTHIASIASKRVLEGLNKYIEKVDADLLVMATTQRNFFETLFHRSLTKQMVFDASVPLMVLHY